jgi:hypothetical protein
MGLPEFKYNPGGGLRTISFPEEIVEINDLSRTLRTVNPTDGGIVSVQFNRREEFLKVVIDKLPMDSPDGGDSYRRFVNDIHTMWTWVSRGGEFSFANDSDNDFQALLNGDHSFDATVIQHKATPTWPQVTVGKRFIIDGLGEGWPQEVVEVANPIVADTSFAIVDPLIFSYRDDDQVRFRTFHPKMVTAQNESPVSELPGRRWRISLRMRSVFDTELN